MKKLCRVLIMAGGTGGHVFPGLAVAKQLQQTNVEVKWLGTPKGLEARLVPEADIPIEYIQISGIRGKGWKDLIFAPWRLIKAIIEARKIIRRFQPDIVIGMGGFVSGPGGIASWLMGIPLIIHEQNAKPGTTNKWLAKVANRVLEAFPNTFDQKSNALTIGNPVRYEIIKIAKPAERFKLSHERLHLLIIGGSLGAAAINQIVPRALAKLPPSERPDVCHQSGEKHYEDTVQFYKDLGVEAEVKAFIKDMDQAYAWADLVLCRAGALTISELCAVGLGAILVPFPYAVDDHQTANALFMVENNAAHLLPQAELTEESLLKLIKQFRDDRQKCYLMAQSAYNSRKIDAAERMLEICEEICQ